MSFEGLIIIQNLVDFKQLLAECKLRNCEDKIRYKIIQYVPSGNISRGPTEAEINDAVSIAKKHFGNVTSSLEEHTHPLKSFRV